MRPGLRGACRTCGRPTADRTRRCASRKLPKARTLHRNICGLREGGAVNHLIKPQYRHPDMQTVDGSLIRCTAANADESLSDRSSQGCRAFEIAAEPRTA